MGTHHRVRNSRKILISSLETSESGTRAEADAIGLAVALRRRLAGPGLNSRGTTRLTLLV